MCTAVTFSATNHYFGRNLDLEFSYGESVVITPRNVPFTFRKADTLYSHHAIIGMAHVAEGIPLYYDATNEFGLSMAGLNFPDNCVYREEEGKEQIASFELIPWVLGQCKTIEDARRLLERLCVTGEPFDQTLPPAPLHWMIADPTGSVTVESVANGLRIYDNPVGVLTNNPPFPIQLFTLNQYFHCTAGVPRNLFSKDVELSLYSRGMGGLGLPGDVSSNSRFVRACFVKLNSLPLAEEKQNVHQVFHILGAVEQQNGCVRLENEQYEITRYTSCCNMEEGIYYYKTYYNSAITAVRLRNADLNGNSILCFPLRLEGEITFEDVPPKG